MERKSFTFIYVHKVFIRHACRVLRMVRGNKIHQKNWAELRDRIREIAQSRLNLVFRALGCHNATRSQFSDHPGPLVSRPLVDYLREGIGSASGTVLR